MRSPTSALAKLLAWDAEAPLEAHEVLAHQADFVAAQLCGTAEGGGFRSDWHNALKLGYDVRRTRCGYTYYGHTRTPAAGRGLPRMYDFSVSKQAAAGAGDAALQLIGEHAPPKHTVRSTSPAPAKLLLALALGVPSF